MNKLFSLLKKVRRFLQTRKLKLSSRQQSTYDIGLRKVKLYTLKKVVIELDLNGFLTLLDDSRVKVNADMFFFDEMDFNIGSYCINSISLRNNAYHTIRRFFVKSFREYFQKMQVVNYKQEAARVTEFLMEQLNPYMEK